MDPPPIPPFPTATTSMTTTTTAHHSYPDSVDSSPRSSTNDTWDEPLRPVPGAKLRLMCSYGGHIIPRPHDKSLCYVGGDTRMVLADRHSTLSDLSARLSRTLLNGRSFTFKYQLPNEDLDSLISVTTDEDLDNMIEEYDRITSSSPLKPSPSSRLRLFLFLAKPETAASMGSLLDDAKSETWFVDALNGTGLLPRGLSDSAIAVDCLLGFDGSDSANDLEAQVDVLAGNCSKQVIKNGNDVVNPIPDSPPMIETSSSFGSSSSTPSMSNLPPIRVRVEDGVGGVRIHDQNKVGLIEEQFAQVSIGDPNFQLKKDDGVIVSLNNAAPPLPPLPVPSGIVESGGACSDDERSLEQGAPVGFRKKPPLPLQPAQHKACTAATNLPSPGSVASEDNSTASASFLSKPMLYQDPVYVAPRENRAPLCPADPKTDISDFSSQFQMQKLQEPAYPIPPQFDHQEQLQQQQYLHPSSHYLHHPPTGQFPVSSYYSMYAPSPHQQLYHQMDQQIPMYILPQHYTFSVQSNMAGETPPPAASSRSLTPANPATITSSVAYKESLPPIYPTKTVKPQIQQQHVNFSQLQNPICHSVPTGSVAATNYAYDYSHPGHDQQVYYTQHPAAATLTSQYQSMTPVAALLVSDQPNSSQLPTDNSKQ